MAITDNRFYAKLSDRFRRNRNSLLAERIVALEGPRILDAPHGFIS